MIGEGELTDQRSLSRGSAAMTRKREAELACDA